MRNKAIVVAALVALTGAAIYEAQRASMLERQLQTLQQQQAHSAELVEPLRRDGIKAQLQPMPTQGEQFGANPSAVELLRLRGEVARLRAEQREFNKSKPPGNDPSQSAAEDLVGKINCLSSAWNKCPTKVSPS